MRALCDLLLDEQVESSTYREPQVQSQIIDHNQSRCKPIAPVSNEPVYIKESDANGNFYLIFRG